MSDSSPADGPSRDSASRSLRGPLLLCLVAIGLVATVHFRNRSDDLRPVYLPLDLSQGSTASAQFVAPEDGGYDIEIEMFRTIPKQQIRRLITPTTTPGELDLQWSVESDGRALAKGSSFDYVFISNVLFRSRLLNELLGLEHYESIRTTRYGRGVGTFAASHGDTISVTAVSGDNPADELAAAEPRLVVRFNRRARAMILRRSVAVLFIAGPLFAFGLVSALIRLLRLRRTQPVAGEADKTDVEPVATAVAAG